MFTILTFSKDINMCLIKDMKTGESKTVSLGYVLYLTNIVGIKTDNISYYNDRVILRAKNDTGIELKANRYIGLPVVMSDMNDFGYLIQSDRTQMAVQMNSTNEVTIVARFQSGHMARIYNIYFDRILTYNERPITEIERLYLGRFQYQKYYLGQIIEFFDKDNITVSFSNGVVLLNQKVTDFVQGRIDVPLKPKNVAEVVAKDIHKIVPDEEVKQKPDLFESSLFAVDVEPKGKTQIGKKRRQGIYEWVGKTQTLSDGTTAEIVDYYNKQHILVKFDDGTEVTTTLQNWIDKKVYHKKQKVYDIGDKIVLEQSKRKGETVTVVAVYGSRYADIQYEDGHIQTLVPIASLKQGYTYYRKKNMVARAVTENI